MKNETVKIETTYELSERAINKIRMMRDPLWLVGRLQGMQGVIGVNFGPDFIGLTVTADVSTAMKTIEQGQQIINEQLI